MHEMSCGDVMKLDFMFEIKSLINSQKITGAFTVPNGRIGGGWLWAEFPDQKE